jgi:hypothetical protein
MCERVQIVQLWRYVRVATTGLLPCMGSDSEALRRARWPFQAKAAARAATRSLRDPRVVQTHSSGSAHEEP